MRPPARTTNVDNRRAARPLALTLIGLTIFLPEGLSFYVFGLRLTATRLIFILLIPILCIRIGQSSAIGRFKFVSSDILFPISATWMILATSTVAGLSEAISHAGPVALEYLIGYFAVRVLLAERGQAFAFVNLICGAAAVVAIVGLLDPLTNSVFTHNAVDSLTGYQKIHQIDYRFGLLRAMGPLEHPILYGLTSSYALLLAISLPIRARKIIIVACSAGLIFSFSSGPTLVGVFGIACLIYDRLLHRFKWRWVVVIGGLVSILLAVFLASKSPLNFLIEHLIFDPESGWVRVLEWQTAGAVLSGSPWMGIALG
jgi:hypothetical protein